MTGDAVREFLVPDLGEGLEEATITGWLVSVGDQVELNQTLCTVETNKAEVEIPSPYAGRVVELGGSDGETLPVGSTLIRIATVAPAASAPEPERRSLRDGTAERQRPGAQAGVGGLRHRRNDGHQQARDGRYSTPGQAAGPKAGRGA